MTIDEATFVLVDSETGGTDPATDDLLEVAAYRLAGETSFESLVRPTQPIPPAASGVHHLVESDFVDAPERPDVIDALGAFVGNDAVLVAHKAVFDRGFLPEFAARPWLCTLRLAQHLLPDAPDYKNSTLYYYLGGPKIAGSLHRAAADLIATRFVFEQLLVRYRDYAAAMCSGDAERLAKSEQVETLIAFAQRPYIMRRMTFSKHRGQLLDEIDVGFFRWALRNMADIDDDFRFNCERQIRLRGSAAA